MDARAQMRRLKRHQIPHKHLYTHAHTYTNTQSHFSTRHARRDLGDAERTTISVLVLVKSDDRLSSAAAAEARASRCRTDLGGGGERFCHARVRENVADDLLANGCCG